MNRAPRPLFPSRRRPGGVAADTAGESAAQYMDRVDAGYRAMNAAITEVVGRKPPQSKEAWEFVNNWWSLFGKERVFYVGNSGDAENLSVLSATAVYAATLQEVRAQYEQHLGEKPPEIDPLRPKQDPGLFDFPAGGSLEGIAGILKWGVIGYLAIQVVGAIRK